jgi:hypothetical protein
VSVALLGFDASTKVPRGENAGRALEEDFIVIDFKSKLLLPTGLEQFAVVRLKRPATWRVRRLGVAAWVTHEGDLKPVQATGGYLESAP